MTPADAAVLAALLKEHYSPDSLETGVSEPTMVPGEDGFEVLVLPREQMFEPFRSFHLLDAVALGPLLLVTFRWDDGTDDGTIFLMPLDTRDVELDMDDDIAVTTFVDHHVSWTLGGPRESWEPQSLLLSPRLAVVQPHRRR